MNSVFVQSFKNYEIIVSDDSTTNEISNYVKDLNVSNLVYFQNVSPLGSPQNWNNTLKQATRKYIKILHHDDYFTHKDSLSKFVDSLENTPGAAFSFSFSNIYFKKDNKLFVHKQTGVQIKRLKQGPNFLFFRNVIGAPSATFFRNGSSLLFDKEYKWLVDVEFYIRCLKKNPHFVAIKEPLVTVVDGEQDQISQAVHNNKTLIISEHLRLFSSIYNKDLETKKALVFFQELFVRFDVLSYDQLKTEFETPFNLEWFLQTVFLDLSKGKLLKAFKKRLLTSRYNKQIFKIERF